jgi:hypothetical protein
MTRGTLLGGGGYERLATEVEVRRLVTVGNKDIDGVVDWFIPSHEQLRFR